MSGLALARWLAILNSYFLNCNVEGLITSQSLFGEYNDLKHSAHYLALNNFSEDGDD